MNYDPDQEGCKDMFLCLIRMYLLPPDDMAEYGIRLPNIPKTAQPKANIKEALAVLSGHHHLIDTAKLKVRTYVSRQPCTLYCIMTNNCDRACPLHSKKLKIVLLVPYLSSTDLSGYGSHVGVPSMVKMLFNSFALLLEVFPSSSSSSSKDSMST